MLRGIGIRGSYRIAISSRRAETQRGLPRTYASKVSNPLLRLQNYHRARPSATPPIVVSHVPPNANKTRFYRFLMALFLISPLILYPQWSFSFEPAPALDPEKFTPFTLVSREITADPRKGASCVSAIFTLKPANFERKRGTRRNCNWGGFWARGVWSVEFKQPELMVARRYTPLPDVGWLARAIERDRERGDAERDTGGHAGGHAGGLVDGEDGELRFLIKLEPTGEVSRWLFTLPLDSVVWLRGPRFEWEYPWWIGLEKAVGEKRKSSADINTGNIEEQQPDGRTTPTEPSSARSVAFLAGGTGIAPALQVAASLLYLGNRKTSSSTAPPASSSSSSPAVETPPTELHILWAVRAPQDIPKVIFSDLDNLTKLASLTSNSTSLPSSPQPLVPPPTLKITTKFHPDTLSAFITPNDILHAINFPSALSVPSQKTSSLSSPFPPSSSSSSSLSSSSWPSFLYFLSSAPTQAPPQPPTLAQEPPIPQDRYIFVSGPDGFIEYFAGAKGPDGTSQGKLGGIIKGIVAKGRAAERLIQSNSTGSDGEKENAEGSGREGVSTHGTRWFVWKL